MGSEPREDLSDDPGTLSLLASAISGRALRVAPGEPGEPAWTDGSAIFVAGDAPTRRQAEAVAVQASLLAAGSLDPEVVRDLVRRPALARRYLAIEGHRALAAMVDWLPPSLRPLVDAEVAARADSPAASLAAARSRKAIAAPPERFGAIRAKKLLRAIDRAERPARTETKVPRAPSEPLDPSASHPAEQGADGAFDLLSSPGDRGGALGRLFARMLSAVRRLRNGGAPDADAPTQRSLARAFGGVHSAISIGGADALEADVFERRGARYPEWDVHRRCYRPDWCT